MKYLFLLSCLLAAVPALAQAPTPLEGTPVVTAATGEIDITSFDKWYGDDAEAKRYSTFVARTNEDWKRLWTEQLRRSPPKPLGKGQMAVAIFLGERESENFSVRIMSVSEVEGNTRVMYLENKPLMAAQAAAETKFSPWVVQVIPASEGSVRFFAAPGAAK